MRFIKEDYVRSRQRRNRFLIFISIIAIIGVFIFIKVFDKPGDEKNETQVPVDSGITPQTVSSQQETKIKDLPSLISMTRKSIGLIKTYDRENNPIAVGTGFFVSGNGRLITNRHVFQDSDHAEVQCQSGKFPVQGVIAEDSNYDLVLLSIDMGDKSITPLKFNTDYPQVGEKVVVIGNPMGLEATVSDGLVSAIREIDPYGKVIQITCPISPGSSGSPVLNLKGEVLGVATFQMLEGQNLNFAIPIMRARPLVAQKGKLDSITKINFGGSTLIDSVADPFEKGRILVDRKEYAGAINFFKQATQKNPSNAEAYYYLGLCYKEVHSYFDAVAPLKKAIELDSNYAEAYCQLGITHTYLNQQTEAISALHRAIEIKPDYDEAMLHLGIAYFSNKQYAASIKVLERALTIYPNNDQAYLFLGHNYIRTEQYEKAIRVYKEHLEIKDDSIEGYLGLGFAYAGVENWKLAIVTLNKSIVIDPQRPEAHYLLGFMHLGNDDLESAQLELRILQNIKNASKFASDLSSAISNYRYYKQKSQYRYQY